MPSKKRKAPKENIEEVKETPVTAPVEVVEASETLCFHVNRHANPNITCILPKGHEGNHYNHSHWSDAAGVPARKHA